jgi:chitodextrinase
LSVTRKRNAQAILIALTFMMCLLPSGSASGAAVSVNLTETSEAFKNPMKGFRPSRYPNDGSFINQEYATIFKHYIPYTNLENSASDPVQKITDWCNSAWAGIEDKNIKIIPRVVIYYPGTGEWWPDGVSHDGTPAEWGTDALKNRLVTFTSKLASAWDNDPRVAAIEMGLWGKWGEHNIYPDQVPGTSSDRIPASFQSALGAAFTSAFKNKKVMVRYENTFTDFNFGYIWDSFALPDDAAWANWESARDNWKTQMISGEVAYDWGNQSQLGGSPNGTLNSNSNTDYVIGFIRSTHCSSLGWIAEYGPDGGTISANAAKMQKEFGYRYVVNSASFPSRADAGTDMSVSFNVTNKGNAPFYYNWPLKANLLRADKSVAWSGPFNTDIRNWMPGNSYPVTGSFTVPSGLATGTYILALTVNDPAGDLPSLRFANTNYYAGGFTPIGKVGVGLDAGDQNLGSFSGLQSDATLHYSLGGGGGGDTQVPTAPTNLVSTGKTDTTVSLSWSASTDNVGVTGYDVYNGAAFAISVTGTSATVSGLSGATAYEFMVKAKDAGGNSSAASNSVSVTTDTGRGGGTKTSYEAEALANTLAGGATVANSASCSGGKKVSYIGNNTGTLQFNNVNAPAAGSYVMTIYFLTAVTRNLTITVNGGTAQTVSFGSSGGWDSVGSKTVSISLNAGNNTILLLNSSGWAPDIDRITVNASGGAVGIASQQSREASSRGLQCAIVNRQLHISTPPGSFGPTRIVLFDGRGAQIARFDDAARAGGAYSFDLRDMPSGVFFVNLYASDKIMAGRKIVLY